MRFQQLKRREFITLLGGAAVWSVVARAQQAAMPVVGYVYPGEGNPQGRSEAAFRQGLRETGFIAGQNVTIEYRYGENQPDRTRENVADLVRRNVAAIASVGDGTARIIKAATSTIPIIFESGFDPVQGGLVASLSHPGGNLTGVNSVIAELWSKQLDLMTKLLPGSHVFGVLPTGRSTAERQPWQQAAGSIGRKLVVATAFTPQELEPAFAALARQGAEALIIGASPLSYSQGNQLAALAARYSLPAIYGFREIPKAGGLMSYGIEIDESLRLLGVYTGRVLKGEKPGDLPVVQPTRYVLTINLSAAKALGLTVPPTLLAIADEVIE
jgi:putative tryptophan/tyrosine transport system substrate-binding protein